MRRKRSVRGEFSPRTAVFCMDKIRHAKCYIKGYPRPQFVRADWLSLDGEWRFAFGEEVQEQAALCGDLPRTIIVPFVYETKASGIGDETPHDTVWYARELKKREGLRNILNIDGADYLATVYVNGEKVGSHEGAYARFSFDITDKLKEGRNLVVIRCDDALSPAQIRGKQRLAPHSYGSRYTQMTGIWKSVWMEYVHETRLDSVRITPYPSDGEAELSFSVSRPAADVSVGYEISLNGKAVCAGSICADEAEQKFRLRITSEKLRDGLQLSWLDWPFLYDVRFTVRKGTETTDIVGSYFAMTDFSVRGDQFSHCMAPRYLKMVLDQGVWPESGFTPPSEEAIIRDIALIKEMGFNAVRKHEKIEDERFYYYADIMGLGVWCEMPSCFSFRESSLALVTAQWQEIIRQHYNHPCIIAWVCFNESWGVREIMESARIQNFVSAVYWLTKAYDARRPVIGNDGWAHTYTDILTVHQYTQDAAELRAMFSNENQIVNGDARTGVQFPIAKGAVYTGQPLVLSEFGGTALRTDAQDGAWGYGNAVPDEESYLARLGALFSAVQKLPFAGYCYTQLTDVQQEVNGLLREDRTPKVPIAEIRRLNDGKERSAMQ